MWIKLMWFFLLKNAEPLTRNDTTTILQINEKWTLQQRYLGQRPFNELTKNECDNNDMGEDNLSGYQAFEEALGLEMWFCQNAFRFHLRGITIKSWNFAQV